DGVDVPESRGRVRRSSTLADRVDHAAAVARVDRLVVKQQAIVLRRRGPEVHYGTDKGENAVVWRPGEVESHVLLKHFAGNRVEDDIVFERGIVFTLDAEACRVDPFNFAIVASATEF